jgi:hypothetical protein
MRPSTTLNHQSLPSLASLGGAASANPASDGLHPILAQTLAHLDCHLEDELIRYRRLKALGKAGYPLRTPSRPPVKPLNTATLPLPVGGRGGDRSQAPIDMAPTHAIAEPTPVSSASFDHPISDFSPSEPMSADSTTTELRQLAQQYAEQVAEQAAEPLNESDAMAEAIPDDYLESSEELLRSLAQEQAGVEAEQGFFQSLLTPLGLGAMLLLLLSSALFGFVIMNPASVSRFFNRSEAPETASAEGSVVDATEPSANLGGSPVEGSTSLQPNLASQELPDLNLGNLAAVESNRPAGDLGAVNPALPSVAPGAGKTVHLGASGSNLGGSGSVGTVLSDRPNVAPSSSASSSAGLSSNLPTTSVPYPSRLIPAAPEAAAPAVPRSYPAYSNNHGAERPASRPIPRYETDPPRAAPSAGRSMPALRKPAPAKSLPPVPSTPALPTPAAPSPEPAQTASPSPAASSSGQGYTVVSPYTNDRDLTNARQQAPDAYLLNTSEGAKIQLGVYRDSAEAKTRAEQLRKQGVPAEVYQP